MATTLLTATTSAVASDSFAVDARELPVHVYCETLGAGETGTIQILVNGTWQDYLDDGSAKAIDENNTGVSVYAPGTYRVNKGATASATGVYMSTGLRE